MRSLARNRKRNFKAARASAARRPALAFLALLATALLATSGFLQGCGGGSTSSAELPLPAPPASINVTLTPTNASVVLGNTQTFTAGGIKNNKASISWR